MDVAPTGRLLLAQQKSRMGVMVQRRGSAQPADVSIRDGSQVVAMSGDGQTVLILESPVLDGSVAADRAYQRRLDGSPALLLAKGTPLTISNDGRWAQIDLSPVREAERDPALLNAYREAGLDPGKALAQVSPLAHLLFVPTGPGRPRVVPLPGSFVSADRASLLPDGRHLLFLGSEKGRGSRWFVTDWTGKQVRPVSPEGYGMAVWGGQNISRDGKRIWILNVQSSVIQELSGGEPIPIKGLEPTERIIGWAADDRSLLTRTRVHTLPIAIARIDPATGVHEPLLTVDLPDRTGFRMIRALLATPDASTVVYTYQKMLSELFVVEGAKN